MSADERLAPRYHLPWWVVPGLAATVPVAAVAGVPLLAHALLHPACAAFVISATVANCAWFGPVVTRFATPRREVWLTIDDGPDPEDTPQLLTLLATHDAHATFFVIGERAAAHPALIRAITDAGHEVAHHTYTHPLRTFWYASPA